jgi:NADH-quinone oxidoreductase subunit G
MTETAVQADVVLPAQSWAEREGTFTSGERRVQRYYPAIQPIGEARPDWQVLAQIGERVGLEKPAFAASLAFRDLAKVVPQYKEMDYRTLAKVEKQWPDVGGADLYYGGNAYENRVGLGVQWSVAAESGSVEQFEVGDVDNTMPAGVALVRTAALFTPGSLINHTELLAPRMAHPTLTIHKNDAASLQLGATGIVSVEVNGKAVAAKLHVNGHAPEGVALLRGVPYQAGLAELKFSKQD